MARQVADVGEHAGGLRRKAQLGPPAGRDQDADEPGLVELRRAVPAHLDVRVLQEQQWDKGVQVLVIVADDEHDRLSLQQSQRLRGECPFAGDDLDRGGRGFPRLGEGAQEEEPQRKTKEGASYPDRNAQFEYINVTVQSFQQRGQPVISVDTRKKELVGLFSNGSQEWRPRGEPEEVKVHDFMDKTLGKAIPYGVSDRSQNEGWVSVGMDHDTARFAVQPSAVGGTRWAPSIIRMPGSC